MSTVGEYATEVLKARQLRVRTVGSYLETVRNLDLWNTPIDELTPQLVFERLLTVLNGNTRRKHTIALRSILRDLPWAKDLKLTKAYAKSYELPDEDTLRIALMLSKYELQGLMMMYAGLRVSEACAIGPGDTKGNVLRVYKQRSEKGYDIVEAKTVGDVIIPTWLGERIRAMEPLTVRSTAVRASLKLYGAKVGIHLTPHMLRHWYCTELVKKRINPEIARRQMRHANLNTTLGYYSQVSNKDIEGIVNELFD